MKKLITLAFAIFCITGYATPVDGWGPHYMSCLPDADQESFNNMAAEDIAHVENFEHFDSNNLLSFKGKLTFWRYLCPNDPSNPALFVNIELLETGPSHPGFYGDFDIKFFSVEKNEFQFINLLQCSNISACSMLFASTTGWFWHPNTPSIAGGTRLIIPSSYSNFSESMANSFKFSFKMTQADIMGGKIEREFTIPALGSNGTVSPTPSSNLNPSGLWYDPALDGLGFNFILAPHCLFIYYYGYDQAGNPLWLSSGGGSKTLTAGQTYELPLYEAQDNNGASFTHKPNPGQSVSEWGKASLKLDSCDKGVMTLTGSDGQQSFNITRLTSIQNQACHN